MRHLALVAWLCLIPFGAGAASAATDTKNIPPTVNGVNNAALNSSPTATFTMSGYNQITIYVAYTRKSGAAATDMTMLCQGGYDGNIMGPIPILRVDDSNFLVNVSPMGAPYKFTIPNASATLPPVQFGLLNHAVVKCTFTSQTANANDVISVYARMGAF